MFGLGRSVAGAAYIALACTTTSRAIPDGVAVLLSVELCSLTFPALQAEIAGFVGGALFFGRRRRSGGRGRTPRGEDPCGRPYRHRQSQPPVSGSQRTMGWDIGATGFKLVLSADVPDVVSRYSSDDVTGFPVTTTSPSTTPATWVSHPGGPKVIEAIVESLDLSDDALELTWRSLAEVGNLSSSSVLHVLHDTIAKTPPAGPGVMMAMGPGFCSELLLLQWH